MDPQSSEHSGINSAPLVNNQLNGQSIDQNLISPNPTIPLPSMPQPSVNAPQTDTGSVAQQTGSPSVADDTDLIEKEWVDKAKQIVERTRDDPYEQSKELTIFKADYMKKRYNRTIKLDE